MKDTYSQRLALGLAVALVVMMAVALFMAVSPSPVIATDPLPATLSSPPQLQKIEDGTTGYTAAERFQLEYREPYPEHAWVEIYASTAISTGQNHLITMTVQSSPRAGVWYSHSDNTTWTTATSSTVQYVIVPHRGMNMAVYYTISGTARYTPTIDVVYSNRE